MPLRRDELIEALVDQAVPEEIAEILVDEAIRLNLVDTSSTVMIGAINKLLDIYVDVQRGGGSTPPEIIERLKPKFEELGLEQRALESLGRRQRTEDLARRLQSDDPVERQRAAAEAAANPNDFNLGFLNAEVQRQLGLQPEAEVEDRTDLELLAAAGGFVSADQMILEFRRQLQEADDPVADVLINKTNDQLIEILRDPARAPQSIRRIIDGLSGVEATNFVAIKFQHQGTPRTGLIERGQYEEIIASGLTERQSSLLFKSLYENQLPIDDASYIALFLKAKGSVSRDVQRALDASRGPDPSRLTADQAQRLADQRRGLPPPGSRGVPPFGDLMGGGGGRPDADSQFSAEVKFAARRWEQAMRLYRGHVELALIAMHDPGLAQRIYDQGSTRTPEDRMKVREILGLYNENELAALGFGRDPLKNASLLGRDGGGGDGGLDIQVPQDDPATLREHMRNVFADLFLSEPSEEQLNAFVVQVEQMRRQMVDNVAGAATQLVNVWKDIFPSDQKLTQISDQFNVDPRAQLQEALRDLPEFQLLYRNKPEGVDPLTYARTFQTAGQQFLGPEAILSPDAIRAGMRTGDVTSVYGRLGMSADGARSARLQSRLAAAAQIIQDML